VGTYLAKFH
jgi:Ser/Thr protein kinase RdoA (MazF antagonist)